MKLQKSLYIRKIFAYGLDDQTNFLKTFKSNIVIYKKYITYRL